MTKDCLEDEAFLQAHPSVFGIRPIRFVDNGKPRLHATTLGHGVPTVDEVREVSDFYYGPPKLMVLWHGLI